MCGSARLPASPDNVSASVNSDATPSAPRHVIHADHGVFFASQFGGPYLLALRDDGAGYDYLSLDGSRHGGLDGRWLVEEVQLKISNGAWAALDTDNPDAWAALLQDGRVKSVGSSSDEPSGYVDIPDNVGDTFPALLQALRPTADPIPSLEIALGAETLVPAHMDLGQPHRFLRHADGLFVRSGSDRNEPHFGEMSADGLSDKSHYLDGSVVNLHPRAGDPEELLASGRFVEFDPADIEAWLDLVRIGVNAMPEIKTELGWQELQDPKGDYWAAPYLLAMELVGIRLRPGEPDQIDEVKLEAHRTLVDAAAIGEALSDAVNGNEAVEPQTRFPHAGFYGYPGFGIFVSSNHGHGFLIEVREDGTLAGRMLDGSGGPATLDRFVSIGVDPDPMTWSLFDPESVDAWFNILSGDEVVNVNGQTVKLKPSHLSAWPTLASAVVREVSEAYDVDDSEREAKARALLAAHGKVVPHPKADNGCSGRRADEPGFGIDLASTDRTAPTRTLSLQPGFYSLNDMRLFKGPVTAFLIEVDNEGRALSCFLDGSSGPLEDIASFDELPDPDNWHPFNPDNADAWFHTIAHNYIYAEGAQLPIEPGYLKAYPALAAALRRERDELQPDSAWVAAIDELLATASPPLQVLPERDPAPLSTAAFGPKPDAHISVDDKGNVMLVADGGMGVLMPNGEVVGDYSPLDGVSASGGRDAGLEDSSPAASAGDADDFLAKLPGHVESLNDPLAGLFGILGAVMGGIHPDVLAAIAPELGQLTEEDMLAIERGEDPAGPDYYIHEEGFFIDDAARPFFMHVGEIGLDNVDVVYLFLDGGMKDVVMPREEFEAARSTGDWYDFDPGSAEDWLIELDGPYLPLVGGQQFQLTADVVSRFPALREALQAEQKYVEGASIGAAQLMHSLLAETATDVPAAKPSGFYRHKDGLFAGKTMRPHWVEAADDGEGVTVHFADGEVREMKVNSGKEGQLQRHIDSGHFVRFDPDNAADWLDLFDDDAVKVKTEKGWVAIPDALVLRLMPLMHQEASGLLSALAGDVAAIRKTLESVTVGGRALETAH